MLNLTFGGRIYVGRQRGTTGGGRRRLRAVTTGRDRLDLLVCAWSMFAEWQLLLGQKYGLRVWTAKQTGGPHRQRKGPGGTDLIIVCWDLSM